jgi:hypothetical protein
MKFEIYNGDNVGTAEWVAPGVVDLEMNDAGDRAFFERFFASEDTFLSGPVESAEMTMERRDASEQAFQRAAFALAAYSYHVRALDREGAAST